MQKKSIVTVAAAMLLAIPVHGIAATTAAPNSVNTAAIQNLAVTNAKIANGAVTAAKLGIVCPTGQYLQYSGTTWACSEGTAGIQGPQGPQGIQGETGLQGPAGATPHYANVAVVAKSGGDYTDPVAAMNDSANWCSAPSVTNPCLVKIMPGEYTLSAKLLQKNYVDIEGSGKLSTKLFGSILFGTGELRDLTIEYGDNVITGGGSPSLFSNLNVIIHVPNPSFNYGAFWEMAGNLQFKNVSITVDGQNTGNAGIWLQSSAKASLDGVAINSMGYGVVRGDVVISNSRIISPNYGAIRDVVGAKVSNTQLDGIVNGGAIKLINCFDVNYNAITNR